MTDNEPDYLHTDVCENGKSVRKKERHGNKKYSRLSKKFNVLWVEAMNFKNKEEFEGKKCYYNKSKSKNNQD